METSATDRPHPRLSVETSGAVMTVTLDAPDRRNAQNAADTAVMAGALSYVRTINWSNATTAAFQRAENNGYNNDGTTSVASR